jgi:hypothetical protein
MSMLDEIGKRFQELIQEGRQWAGRVASSNGYYVDNAAFGWLTSAANLVETVTQGRGTYAAQAQELLKHEHLRIGVPTQCVVKMGAILTTLQTDWAKGLVREIEYLISAENFDAFLDHAEKFHKGGQERESGVLASIVFEDAIRKLAKKHGMNPNAEVELLIDEIAKTNAMTPVMARRLKGGPAALRNKALHAKWKEFNIKDVGEAIRTTRELLQIL